MLLAMRADTECENVKAQAQTCATELGEVRAELADRRVAHEIEMKKRVIAEARVVKLEAKLATIRAECDDDIDEENVVATVVEAPVETDDEPMAPAAEAFGRAWD